MNSTFIPLSSSGSILPSVLISLTAIRLWVLSLSFRIRTSAPHGLEESNTSTVFSISSIRPPVTSSPSTSTSYRGRIGSQASLNGVLSARRTISTCFAPATRNPASLSEETSHSIPPSTAVRPRTRTVYFPIC